MIVIEFFRRLLGSIDLAAETVKLFPVDLGFKCL